jgi:hypothetical protein
VKMLTTQIHYNWFVIYREKKDASRGEPSRHVKFQGITNVLCVLAKVWNNEI